VNEERLECGKGFMDTLRALLTLCEKAPELGGIRTYVSPYMDKYKAILFDSKGNIVKIFTIEPSDEKS